MDPLSVGTGLLAIITAAATAANAVHNAVQGIRTHRRRIRQLQEGLVALQAVLQALRAYVEEGETTFESLKLPLVGCYDGCMQFSKLIESCNKHSDGSKNSIRDWVKAKYLEDDIIHLTDTLAAYKATISIALADATLCVNLYESYIIGADLEPRHSTTVTLKTLNDYREEVQKAQDDLEDQLSQIQEKLEYLSDAGTLRGGRPRSELERFRAEKIATEHCLVICKGFQAHIDSMRFQGVLRPYGSHSDPDTPRELSHASKIANATVHACKTEVDDAVKRLELLQHELSTRLRLDAERPVLSEDGESDTDRDYKRLQREAASTRQCIAVCADAAERATPDRVHVAENFSAGDDGRQLFVSSVGDLFSVKGVHGGNRAIQVVGSMPAESLGHLFGSYTQH